MGIAQQLEPYIKSITSLMEQIQPEVGGQQQSQPLAALAGKALKREVGPNGWWQCCCRYQKKYQYLLKCTEISIWITNAEKYCHQYAHVQRNLTSD